MPQMTLETLNLGAAERRLCAHALTLAGNIVGAAALLGITRHAMKRRIVKLGLERPHKSLRIQPGASAEFDAIPANF